MAVDDGPEPGPIVVVVVDAEGMVEAEGTAVGCTLFLSLFLFPLLATSLLITPPPPMPFTNPFVCECMAFGFGVTDFVLEGEGGGVILDEGGGTACCAKPSGKGGGTKPNFCK